MSFDLTKLPREQILRELLPDQDLRPDGRGPRAVHCRLPGDKHLRGDLRPSLLLNPDTGWFDCPVCGKAGTTWKALVELCWGEDRWKQLAGSQSRVLVTLKQRWEELKPETAWTQAYGILPELSNRYLRSGHRYAGDPCSDSIIGIWEEDDLQGIKARLPEGETWRVGVMKQKDPHAKYAWVKGSKAKTQLFLGDRLGLHLEATVVFCAGEKDALVAASHLDPEQWCPVTGTIGEGRPPEGVARKLKGRRVVIAYDGDGPGQAGAWKLFQLLRHHAEVTVAQLPEDVPPGGEPTKPGWDVADVVEHRGADQLELLLELAGDEPPASWEPEDVKPRQRPPTPPLEEAFLGEQTPPPTSHVERELDGWEVHQGMICSVTFAKQSREPRHKAKFLGTARITRVVSSWSEDPESPTGWTEDQEVTYAFELVGGQKLERVARPGSRAWRALLEHTDLALANHALSRADQDRLWLWVSQTAASAGRSDERRAIGPHARFGWLAAPHWSVKNGELTKTPYVVAAPGEAQVLERYRLDDLHDADFKRVARWIVGKLMRCDRADRGYTLPLLGAFLSAPLWETLPELRSWQRTLFFVQGPSGVGKTQLCRYFMSFWGDFVSGGEEEQSSGLTTWISSATYVGALLHEAKGVPFFVSDWKRKNFTSKDKLKDALGLVQAYADRSSRGRGTQSGGAQRSRPPRCTWVVDGEDLPEGEQATLGRMTILNVHGRPGKHGAQAGLCADASSETLDPELVALLPGVTARWIAWVQRSTAWLTTRLRDVLGQLDQLLEHGSTNRARILRSYAVQVLTVSAFAAFLEHEAGLAGQVADLGRRSLDVHVDMANRQLGHVQREAAGEQFLTGLGALLRSGAVQVAAVTDHSGENPFDYARENSPTVGTFHQQRVLIWPDVALPLVQQHVSRGGGERIEFSRAAIEQQLKQDGLLESPRARVEGHPKGMRRIKVWRIRLHDLGVDTTTQEELYEEV